jgi:hypothetical protein
MCLDMERSMDAHSLRECGWQKLAKLPNGTAEWLAEWHNLTRLGRIGPLIIS